MYANLASQTVRLMVRFLPRSFPNSSGWLIIPIARNIVLFLFSGISTDYAVVNDTILNVYFHIFALKTIQRRKRDHARIHALFLSLAEQM